MSTKLPYTRRERRRVCQCEYGHRPVNMWGDGDLPAPWAEGDIVEWVRPHPDERRMREVTGQFLIVDTAFSIDDGDGWYFRVTTPEFYNEHGLSSDRHHVWWLERCNFGNKHGYEQHLNYMSGFDLVDTADPAGLALRAQMLADGWELEPTDNPPDHWTEHDLVIASLRQVRADDATIEQARRLLIADPTKFVEDPRQRDDG